MKYALYLLIVLVVLSSTVFMSCGVYKPHEPEPSDEYKVFLTQLSESPRSDSEAELMVLWLTGRVVAYRTDYDRIRNSLARVRSAYGDSIPFLNSQQFVYSMSESSIGVILDSSTIVQFRDGEYSDWDSLNTLYRLSVIDTSHIGWQGSIYLTFEPRLNTHLLLESYRDLASITSAFTGYRLHICSNVYPWFDGDNETFLFREAYCDYCSEYESNEFWYFCVVGDSVEYVGKYAPDDGDPVPAWWDEAKIAYYEYSGIPY